MNVNHKAISQRAMVRLPIAAAIEAKEVCFSYPDGTAALKEINISIPKGEFAGVLGGNGSGKTTLLRLLNGLLKPAKGDILIEGKISSLLTGMPCLPRSALCFKIPRTSCFLLL